MNRDAADAADIKKYTNADGSTNWEKLEAGDATEFFRFERIGQTGYGAIEKQNGKWFVVAEKDGKWQNRETTREQVLATIAKIKAQPSVFKVIRDYSSSI